MWCRFGDRGVEWIDLAPHGLDEAGGQPEPDRRGRQKPVGPSSQAYPEMPWMTHSRQEGTHNPSDPFNPLRSCLVIDCVISILGKRHDRSGCLRSGSGCRALVYLTIHEAASTNPCVPFLDRQRKDYGSAEWHQWPRAVSIQHTCTDAS